MMGLPEEKRPKRAKDASGLKKANMCKQHHTGSNPSPQAVWNRRNKEKLKAHRAVAAALKRGEIEREPCFICGDPVSEAHHRSYRPEHWLLLTFLCRKHHRQLHAVWHKCEVPEI